MPLRKNDESFSALSRGQKTQSCSKVQEPIPDQRILPSDLEPSHLDRFDARSAKSP